MVEDLERQLYRQKVSIQKDQEVTLDVIKKFQPEALIFATGSSPLVPDVEGIDSVNVVNCHEVLSGCAKTGDRAVVIGGGSTGAETAEFLTDSGKKVIICEMLEDVIMDAEPMARKLMLKRLSEKGVRILINCKAKAVKPGGLVVERNEKEELIETDTVVLSVGMKPNRGVIDQYRAKGFKNIEIYEIGDCVEPHKALEAMSQGLEIGEKV
jgi:pyruvate/2-oxoglutarate dehydrogenase complex dihydrolipoamide dehydrogenase (E3) component